MSDLLDTVMNIEVFAFIGLLVWLYFKDSPGDDGPDRGPGEASRRDPPRPSKGGSGT